MKWPARKGSTGNALGVFVTGALLGAAVQKELSKPPAERTWEGKVGPVPYDLRPPTIGRVRDTWWDPQGSVVRPQPFGVGWTVNAGRVVRLARQRRIRVPPGG